MATTFARRGLLPRALLAPLQAAVPPCRARATPALARTGASVRDLIRESKHRSAKELHRGDVNAPTPSAEMQGLADQMRNKMLLPGTFVPLPLSKWPLSPPSFIRYLYAVIHARVQASLMTWSYRLSSAPRGSIRPRFKLQSRQIVPTARVLHRRLNEALAAGDRAALDEVCHEPLRDMLSRALAGRKKGEKMEWALVESHSRLLLPRVVAHRAMGIPDSRWGQQSAVVRFDTTQRLTTRDAATGKVVKGGLKAQRKRENLVLMRSVDGKGYKPEEWKIWGFEDEMTLKGWQDMEKGKKALQQSGIRQRMKEFGV